MGRSQFNLMVMANCTECDWYRIESMNNKSELKKYKECPECGGKVEIEPI